MAQDFTRRQDATTAGDSDASRLQSPFAFYASRDAADWITLGADWVPLPLSPGSVAAIESPGDTSDPGQSFELGEPAVTYDGTRVRNPSGIPFTLATEIEYQVDAPDEATTSGLGISALLPFAGSAFLSAWLGLRRSGQAMPPPRVELGLVITPNVSGEVVLIKVQGVQTGWGEGSDLYHFRGYAGGLFRPNGGQLVARVQADPTVDAPPPVRIRATSHLLTP